MIASAYLAAEGFEAPLAEELERLGVGVAAWHGRLALSPNAPRHAAWALDIWTAPQEIAAPSVKAAADALRCDAAQLVRLRGGPSPPLRPDRRTPAAGEGAPARLSRRLPPRAHLGAWTLLEPDRLLASATKSSPFVNGECRFVEDRAGPPSRAYLKLWEAWTRLGTWPAARRNLPRSRRRPWRLELGGGAARRAGDRGGQGAARPRNRRHAGRLPNAPAAPSRWSPSPWTGCSAT